MADKRAAAGNDVDEPTSFEADAPSAPPAVGDDRDALLASFWRQPTLTLGLEEDLMLLDGETLEISPAAEEILVRLQGDPRYRHELRAGKIESVTPVAGNARAAGLHLARGRMDLATVLEPGIVLGASGTHPFSSDPGPATGDDLHRELALEYGAELGGKVPCGLHVHVGFGGADRCLAVYNAVRSYLPEIAALAANSPYSDGADSGLACARRPVNGAFRRSGIPPAFPSWDSFFELLEWGRTGGLVPDGSDLWWDLRPHTKYGTLELRVPDVQTRVEDAVAIAGLFQTLVAQLARMVDEGAAPPVHASVRIEENAWRAMRYGVRGLMVDLDTGAIEPARERIGRLLNRLGPIAEELGNLDALHTAQLLMADNGAERQRYVCSHRGLYGLTRWLADETIASAAEYLSRRV